MLLLVFARAQLFLDELNDELRKAEKRFEKYPHFKSPLQDNIVQISEVCEDEEGDAGKAVVPCGGRVFCGDACKSAGFGFG